MENSVPSATPVSTLTLLLWVAQDVLPVAQYLTVFNALLMPWLAPSVTPCFMSTPEQPAQAAALSPTAPCVTGPMQAALNASRPSTPILLLRFAFPAILLLIAIPVATPMATVSHATTDTTQTPMPKAVLLAQQYQVAQFVTRLPQLAWNASLRIILLTEPVWTAHLLPTVLRAMALPTDVYSVIPVSIQILQDQTVSPVQTSIIA